MVDIMSHIHQYVPSVSSVHKEVVMDEEVEIVKEQMHQVLMGGDQMTAARARSAILAKANAESPSKCLQGLIPTLEDWHCRANFLGVSRNCLLNCASLHRYHFRSCGSISFRQSPQQSMVPYTNYVTLSIVAML